MPYKIKKVKGGYKVCKKDGSKCFSDDPMSKEDAEDQMKAMYSNESTKISFSEVFYEDDNNPCWDGYEKVKGKKDYEKGSCRKKKKNKPIEEQGLSEGMTVQDIADKHNASIQQISKQLEMGMKVEMEHTSSPEESRRITMDHLVEDPKYYSKLRKMESGH